MRSYALLMLGLAVIFLGLFVLAEALEVPLLTDPSPWLEEGKGLAAFVGFALLTLDVLLPVPSSLVMIAHGALFGVALGAALSLFGGLAAAAVGFVIGRRSTVWLERLVSEEERRRADFWLSRHGEAAVVISRPVPILAESVAILAGTSSMGWGRFLVASLAGTIPAALVYALTGATAARLDSSVLIFGLVLAITALFWWVGRRRLPGDGPPVSGDEATP